MFAIYTFGAEAGVIIKKKKLIGLYFKEWSSRFLLYKIKKNVGQKKTVHSMWKMEKIVKNGFCYIAKSIKIYNRGVGEVNK